MTDHSKHGRNALDFDKTPALRTIAMPADTNANGDMFGGWLLSQMDLAGSILAAYTSKTKIATVAVDAMKFYRPVYVGDEVSCYTKIERIGTTSITILIETWVRRRQGEESELVTEGKFTYVAIGEDRRPVPVLPEKRS